MGATTNKLNNIDVRVEICEDVPGNTQVVYSATDRFSIDIEDQSTAIDPISVSDHITAYPNPVYAGGVLFVEVKEANTELQLELVTIQGQIVERFVLSDVLNQIEVPNIQAGVYYLRSVNDSERSVILISVVN